MEKVCCFFWGDGVRDIFRGKDGFVWVGRVGWSVGW